MTAESNCFGAKRESSKIESINRIPYHRIKSSLYHGNDNATRKEKLDPNLPGQYFPRVSGMRFRYDRSRPKFDAVTQIELGDLASGYRDIDISATGKELYSITSNLYLAPILASIPVKTKGALALAPKKKDGTPLKSRADALPDAQSGPYLLPPMGTIDKDEVMHYPNAAALEVKEWQAIMNYLKSLPTKNAQGVTVLAMDARAAEVRAIKAG